MFYAATKSKKWCDRLLPKKEKPELKSEKAFFTLVKTAFQQRRKTLRNACKGLFAAETLEQDEFLIKERNNYR